MKIANSSLEFIVSKMSKEDAKLLFKDCTYKLQLIDSVKDSEVTIYKVGDFADLCRDPHIYSTSIVKAFPIKKQLQGYKKLLEEAAKHDHREIGKKQDLFSFHQESPGNVFWHNNGMIIKNEIINYWIKEHLKNNYKQVNTPIILNRSLWERS